MRHKGKPHKNIGISLGIIVIIGVFFSTIFLGKKPVDTSTYVADQNSSNNTITDSTSTPVTSTPTITPKTTTVTNTPVDTPKKAFYKYKNGTYTATGSYDSPAGIEQVAVTVTIENDIVTDASVTNEAMDNTSSRYQDKFISGYRQYVVGKNISTINLGRISGSSLTGMGFNSALAKIKSQALA